VRVESTDVDSEGYLLDGDPATTPQRLNSGGDYVEALPALLVNYRPTPDFVFRGAVTRALGRPDYDTIAPRSTYSDDGVTATLFIGNPNVKARKSWNYDLSAEWYPNDLTAITASVFYKDITDQIGSVSETFTGQAAIDAELARRGITGQDTSLLNSLTTTTPVNAGEAYLQGFEIAAQTQFEFLPAPFDGLGFSAAATFIEGEVTNQDGSKSPLQGQPEETYAFTGFYQKGPIDISISYAYNASYLTDFNTDPNFNLDQGEFGRWDAKISYAFNDNFKMFLEGVNLNDEPTSEFQGGNENWNTEYEYVGRTIYLGASWGF
jgi:TonB-dependent receptor